MFDELNHAGAKPLHERRNSMDGQIAIIGLIIVWMISRPVQYRKLDKQKFGKNYTAMVILTILLALLYLSGRVLKLFDPQSIYFYIGLIVLFIPLLLASEPMRKELSRLKKEE